MRTVFSKLELGAWFSFVGSDIKWCKCTDFAITGAVNGVLVRLNAINKDFSTDDIVDFLYF